MNAIHLEKHLISPDEWQSLYNEMPKQCQEIVDECSKPNEPSQCYGIGRNDKNGWFVLGSGQGPHVIWVENWEDDIVL